MLTRFPIVIVLFSLVLGACGNGIDEGSNLTKEQRFLLALKGTWTGTAAEVYTINHSDIVVFEMNLPDDGQPVLEGLTGFVRFGEEAGELIVDPDDPGLETWSQMDLFRDGHRFELMNLAIIENRLLTEIQKDTQWAEFCESQTEIYEGGGQYSCSPSLPGWGCCREANDVYKTYIGPNGEEATVLRTKQSVCEEFCTCTETACTVEGMAHGDYEFDITVDIENGLMLGTGSLGRIEAVKQ